jgi:hypothetical protein
MSPTLLLANVGRQGSLILEALMELSDELIGHLKTKVSRGQMLKAAGAGFALAGIPGAVAAAGTNTGSAPAASFPFFPATSGTYTTESLDQIVQNLLTYEYFRATGFTLLVTQVGSKLTDLERLVLQASIAQTQYHIDFLQTLVPGIQPLYTSISLDLSRLPIDLNALNLPTLRPHIGLEATSLYITAAREFAELGQPTLVQYATQISATYAEFEGIVDTFSALIGDPQTIPPNDEAFEPSLFLYTGDVITDLKKLGVLGGSGPQVSYPGRAAVLAATGAMASKVGQQTPSGPPAS